MNICPFMTFSKCMNIIELQKTIFGSYKTLDKIKEKNNRKEK